MNVNVGIIGANGNIGKQAIEVALSDKLINLNFIVINKNFFNIINIVKNSNIKNIVVLHKETYTKILTLLPSKKFNIYYGLKAFDKILKKEKISIILNAVSGFNGLDWTIKVLENKIDLALANKESLVVAGKIVMNLAKKKKVKIWPVDSEHSAIFQCLKDENAKKIKRLILTCSGGPFRDLNDVSMFGKISLKDALKHPNWSMGKKITIDSSTLFNKVLEIIEARWLFDTKKINVIIHYESIIHSMVEFYDGSILAQLGKPSMKTPIAYALTFGSRNKMELEKFDILKISSLNFKNINSHLFPVIKLGYEAIEKGGSYPVVLNAANEFMVQQFLSKKCSYLDIYKNVYKYLKQHKIIKNPSLEQIKKIHYQTFEDLRNNY